MKKMKLSLDDLKVESFQTTPESAAQKKGTVFGYITQDLTLCQECPTNTCGNTCQGPTCEGTCDNTCQGPTCEGTCGEATCGQCAPTCPELCGTFACFYCTRRDC